MKIKKLNGYRYEIYTNKIRYSQRETQELMDDHMTFIICNHPLILVFKVILLFFNYWFFLFTLI